MKIYAQHLHAHKIHYSKMQCSYKLIQILTSSRAAKQYQQKLHGGLQEHKNNKFLYLSDTRTKYTRLKNCTNNQPVVNLWNSANDIQIYRQKERKLARW